MENGWKDSHTGENTVVDIIIDRLKREFKVECNQGKPQVNYKEAITSHSWLPPASL